MAVHPITISSSALKQHIPGKMVQTAETSMMITQKKKLHIKLLLLSIYPKQLKTNIRTDIM